MSESTNVATKSDTAPSKRGRKPKASINTEPTVELTNNQKFQLISLVRAVPGLWDQRNPNYYKVRILQQEWVKVAQLMSIPTAGKFVT